MTFVTYTQNKKNDIIVIHGSDLMTTFKEYRKKRGYTLEELAEICDISWRNLQRIENGTYKKARFETISKIIKTLKIEDKDIIKIIKEQ